VRSLQKWQENFLRDAYEGSKEFPIWVKKNRKKLEKKESSIAVPYNVGCYIIFSEYMLRIRKELKKIIADHPQKSFNPEWFKIAQRRVNKNWRWIS